MNKQEFLEIVKPLSSRELAHALNDSQIVTGIDLTGCSKTMCWEEILSNPPTIEALEDAVQQELAESAKRKSAQKAKESQKTKALENYKVAIKEQTRVWTKFPGSKFQVYAPLNNSTETLYLDVKVPLDKLDAVLALLYGKS